MGNTIQGKSAPEVYNIVCEKITTVPETHKSIVFVMVYEQYIDSMVKYYNVEKEWDEIKRENQQDKINISNRLYKLAEEYKDIDNIFVTLSVYISLKPPFNLVYFLPQLTITSWTDDEKNKFTRILNENPLCSVPNTINRVVARSTLADCTVDTKYLKLTACLLHVSDTSHHDYILTMWDTYSSMRNNRLNTQSMLH